MAAVQIAKPGTQYGPCIEKCEHTDCDATRKMAQALCSLCEKPIGYGVRFFIDEGGR